MRFADRRDSAHRSCSKHNCTHHVTCRSPSITTTACKDLRFCGVFPRGSACSIDSSCARDGALAQACGNEHATCIMRTSPCGAACGCDVSSCCVHRGVYGLARIRGDEHTTSIMRTCSRSSACSHNNSSCCVHDGAHGMTCGRLRANSIVSTRHNSNNESHVNCDTTCENSGHNMRTVGRASTVTGTGFTRASDVLGRAIILAVSTGFTSADGEEMAPDTPTYIHGHYRITSSVCSNTCDESMLV